MDRALKKLPGRFARIAAEVRRRSPRAILVFVDYTTVLPESGDCPDRLPLTAEQLAQGRALARELEQTTRIRRPCCRRAARSGVRGDPRA